MKRIQRPEVNGTILQGSYRVCLEKVWRAKKKNGKEPINYYEAVTVTKLGQNLNNSLHCRVATVRLQCMTVTCWEIRLFFNLKKRKCCLKKLQK